MKIFLMILLSLSSLTANYCYKDKSANKTICYKKYFNRDNIYKAKSDETYYESKNGSIYGIDDKIEIKFNRIGAILSLEDDFEIRFFDKLKNDTYIFKVKNPNELFSILSNLNELDAIAKAVPKKTRKFTRAEIKIRNAQIKKRFQKVMDKMKNKNKNKNKKNKKNSRLNVDVQWEKEKNNKPKNLLRGEH